MSDFEKQERMREARRRRAAQRNRAGRLRGRVVVASVMCFALLWAVVFIQMATGNDPVLGEKTLAASRRAKHREASGRRARPEAVEAEAETAPEVESDPPAEVEPEFEPEAEIPPEPESEVQPEPEVELEPLTTSQS